MDARYFARIAVASFSIWMMLWNEAAAQAYPLKPLKLVTPFPPGGSADVIARLTAQKLGETLGQPVVVDNRGGAGGKAGTEVAAKAAPDGYTLLLGSSGALTMSPAFYRVGYDPIKDFATTSLVSIVPLVLSVHPSLPVHNVKELIALAKKRSGTLTMASAGPGSTTHLTGELFQLNNGIKFVLEMLCRNVDTHMGIGSEHDALLFH